MRAGSVSFLPLAWGSTPPYFDPRRGSGNLLEANRLALIDELRRARELSPSGVIGINSMVAVRDHETLVRTAAEQGANIIISGAGLPLKFAGGIPGLIQRWPWCPLSLPCVPPG